MRPLFRPVAIAILIVAGLTAVPGPPVDAAVPCGIGAPEPAFDQQVSLSPTHAQVWRLYQAFFLRQPDEAGFDYWTRVRSDGATLADIAYQFSVGPEFRNRYGDLSHTQYVDLAYANVLCRPTDPEGHAYWTGQLQSGALTRWDMMIYFAELREYLRKTSTCHSTYPAESAAVAACPEANLVPLGSATLAANGYRPVSVQHRRRNGAIGSFEGVEVDIARGVFSTGADRCSVASINGNWLVASEKDRPNPGVLGVGVVDGVQAKGSSDRADRGVFGLRFEPSPTSVVEDWPDGRPLHPDDTRLNSIAYHHGRALIESWHASAETSPFPYEKVAAEEWVWAAAGVPLIIDGQVDADFAADYARDPYTYQTLGHPFVAVDQNTGRLIFGATSSLDVRDLVDWAWAAGYEDLVKFDGGGSVEYNVAGHAVVAGTPRDIPVWLGVGC